MTSRIISFQQFYASELILIFTEAQPPVKAGIYITPIL